MSPQEFFDKNNGVGLNIDGAYGNQCVDVFLAYNRDVVGGPTTRGNAIDYWTNFPTSFYDKIINTPDAIPQEGDIVIWNIGQYGHIAIFVSGDVNAFISFDQNWPVSIDSNGVGYGVCHFQAHPNYTNVVGWLRPKKSVIQSPDMPPYLRQLFQEANIDPNNEGQTREFWQRAIEEPSVKVDLNNANNALAYEKNLNNNQFNQITELITASQKLTSANDIATRKITDLTLTNNQQAMTLIDLRKQLADCQSGAQNSPLPAPPPLQPTNGLINWLKRIFGLS